jgi:hypothetical protein
MLMHLADTYIVAGTQLRIKCYANATTFLDEVCSLHMFNLGKREIEEQIKHFEQ